MDMTFMLHVFPPVLAYFVVAFLAVTPRTRAIRVALWPMVALLAWRATAFIGTSLTEPGQRYKKTVFIFSMISIVTRTMEWTLAKEPLVRHTRSADGHRSTILDAIDLACNFRGIGWEWSRGTYIPRETRPMDRKGFTLHVMCSAVIHALISGVLYKAVQSFSPTDIGSAGGSIFDDTLPFHARYLRASTISLLAALGIYATFQACYNASTLVAVLVLGHAPEQWPPALDAPWRATSIRDFWGRRWHQFWRRMFLVLGGYPLGYVFGRPGVVVGAFIASAVLHHVVMVTLDDQLEVWRSLVGFGMMAPVVLAEIAFEHVTGRRVSGVVGWVWTMGWLLVWGNLIIDGFTRAGVFGGFNFVGEIVPREDIVEDLVARLDTWLRMV